MKENSVVIDNAQQSLSYQPQNVVGQLRQEINANPDSFAQLSDTSFSNLSNGQIPKWNSTTSKWENANESGGGGLPAWNLLAKIYYGSSDSTFELPAEFSELYIKIWAKATPMAEYYTTASMFIAQDVDFDISGSDVPPIISVPIWQGSNAYWAVFVGSRSNNKKIYTFTSNFSGFYAEANIYYR
jgi:hypothetical protein